MLIDSHCHLHDLQFFSEEEAEKAIVRAREAGVSKIICIGTDPKDSLAAKDFAEKHEGVYWTYGIHPSEATNLEAGALSLESRSGARPAGPFASDVPSSAIRVPRGERPWAAGASSRLASLRTPLRQDSNATPNASKLVAIGEVGLDYHYEGYDRYEQIKLFEEMLQLAEENDLPVSFHVREAFDDFFAVVANFPKICGVVHSFSDNKKNLKRILNETDFYIGVNGLATYSTLPMPPIEKILLETDAPFLAPVPYRGEKNEPAYVPDIAKWLGSKLDLPVEEIAKITTDNCEKLFRI